MSSPSAPDAPLAEDGDLDAAPVHLLLGLATRVTATLDPQVVLDESLAALRQLIRFDGGAIQLIEDGMLVAAATDPPMAPEARTVRIPVGQGVSGTIAATGQAIYIPDITIDPRVYPDGRKKGLSGSVRSYYGVPLILGGGPIGVVQIDSLAVDAFDARKRALVLAFVPTIAAAVQNALIVEQERETLRQLEEVKRLKDTFVAIVSHELRTPLATTMGFAETLAVRLHELAPDQAVDLARRVLDSSGRLQQLIDDLLYAAQLEDRFQELPAEPTELGPIVSSAVEHNPHPNAVEVDLPAQLPLVMVDAHRLREILARLLDNAGKFSPPEAAISIVAEPTASHVDVHVEDRGRGIPEAARAAIFELFVQAEPPETRSVGGLGIGLHVVRRLADAMAVTVTVAERAGGGTRFTVRLPVSATP